MSACESGYPLAPTPCDEYCRAVQRAARDEDRPAECVRDGEALSLDDCELGCLHPSPRCREVSQRCAAYLLDLPVECRDRLEPDARPADQVPCFDEALAALACDHDPRTA